MLQTKNLISTSPINGKKYIIPECIDDKEKIDDFLNLHKGKQVVVVQGLGFVGAVMALVVANALTEEYAVIGVDVATENSYWKVQSINEGDFPIIAADPKIETCFNTAKQKKNLLATCDSYAYTKACFIIVDINLDVQKLSDKVGALQGFDVDINPFKKAIQTIAANCKPDALILVETTVPPGACQKIVYPILKTGLQERGLPTDKIKVGHSYERVMPGPNYIDSIQNFYRVFSGINEESAAATEAFLRTIIHTHQYPLTKLNNTQATEMAKVLENSYRAINIAFMVEWSRFAEKAGVDIYDVVNAIRMRPTHKNIMLPGLGVGGYCLTKDALLASWANTNLFENEAGLHQSEKGVAINDQMPYYAYLYLKSVYKESLSGKKVLLLGVSYLNDVGDTRYTPVEGFYNQLMDAGCQVFLHDPHVAYWEEKQLPVSGDLDGLLADVYDIIAITTGHKCYRNSPSLQQRLLGLGSLFIYDTIGVLTNIEIETLKNRHIVKVLGRGDL